MIIFETLAGASARHTYSAYVTPAGGSEVAIGVNYAFRSEQSAVGTLATWAPKTPRMPLPGRGARRR